MSVRCLARPAIRMIHMHTSTSICLCIYTCTFRSLQLCLLLLLQSCDSRQEGPPSFPPSALSPSLPLSLLSSSLWCRPSLALAQEPLCQVQAQEGAPAKPLTRGIAAPRRRLALALAPPPPPRRCCCRPAHGGSAWVEWGRCKGGRKWFGRANDVEQSTWELVLEVQAASTSRALTACNWQKSGTESPDGTTYISLLLEEDEVIVTVLLRRL